MPRFEEGPAFDLPPFTWHTETPAPGWEHALITGGGRVGAMVFGDIEALTVSVSHERFFLPANPRPHAPVVAPLLGEIRAALREGDSERASDLLERAAAESGYDDRLIWTDPLGICATLVLRGARGALSRRDIDLERGEVQVTWEDEVGGRCALVAVAPRDREEVWLRLESERPLTIEAELGLSNQAEREGGFTAKSYADSVRAVATGGAEGRIEVTSREASASAECARTVVQAASLWTERPGAPSLTSALSSGPEEPCVLRIAVGVSGKERADESRTAAQPIDPVDWDSVRETQLLTHGELVGRSRLRLDGDPRPSTVEQLWRRARDGDAAARRRVVEVAYLSGRANAISATGELPPTLQGIWQGTWSPAWSADFTMNGNVQNGGAASLIPTGTPELARSLLRLVLPHSEDYRENARRIYGAQGMMLPARMSNHGRADHFGRPFPHVFWVGCGGWVLRFAADIVETTGDRSFVDDELWELVIGVLEFAETAMERTDEGLLRISPSYSPENHPFPGASPLVTDATVDIAILRDAARATRLLGEARGDRSLDARWQRIVEALPPYRIAEDGSLAEWIGDHWPENHGHRHTSQLYPLWYDVDEAFVGPSEEASRLREAAARTIAARIAWRAEDPTAPPGRMEMAFGLNQLGAAAAALGDGESALTCVEWLAIEHWTPSLTTTHDAGRIFNLDPSGGLPALVAAMLLGSGQGSLTVLPALPEAWAGGGAITGLRARGGVIVDHLEWDGAGGRITLRRPAESAWLAPEVATRMRSGDRFRFEDGAVEADGLVIGEDPITLRVVNAR